MYKISELIGKQSITLLDAENRGVVFGAYFDKSLRRLKQLLLLSDDEERMFLVDYKSLSSLHSDAVVVRSGGAIKPLPEDILFERGFRGAGATAFSEEYSASGNAFAEGFRGTNTVSDTVRAALSEKHRAEGLPSESIPSESARPAFEIAGAVASPINLPAFNQDGKSLGFIRDILMEDSAVCAFITDTGEIPAGTLLSHSDEVVVFNDTGEEIKLVRPKKVSAAHAKKSTASGKSVSAAFVAPTFANSQMPSARQTNSAILQTAPAQTTNPQSTQQQSTQQQTTTTQTAATFPDPNSPAFADENTDAPSFEDLSTDSFFVDTSAPDANGLDSIIHSLSARLSGANQDRTSRAKATPVNQGGLGIGANQANIGSNSGGENIYAPSASGNFRLKEGTDDDVQNSRRLNKNYAKMGNYATGSAPAEDRQVETPAKVTPPGAVPPISDINLLKFAFLLGKRLCRSIYSDSGRLVAKENDLVTESVIRRAKENGKLVAVALHSL